MTCTHNLIAGKPGLCRTCQEEYDYDPQAWIDYGHHPQGEANWQALQDEIAADAANRPAPSEPDPDIPF